MNLPEETKRITLEYIKTGYECYHKLLKYINGDMKGNLDLSNTKVSYIPKGLKVGGNLDLYKTPITSLPKDLTVGGFLNLYNTPITSLPKDLKVGDDLDLENTDITTLPEDLNVGKDLYLGNTPINEKYTIQELRQMLPNVKGSIYS